MRNIKNVISVGDTFGAYKVIELLPNKLISNGNRPKKSIKICKCECICGIQREVRVDNLLNGVSKSCGGGNCSTRRQTQKEKYGYKEAGEQARNYIFLNYQSNARQRNRLWELTFEDFCEITSKDCYYCGAKPSNSTKDKHGEGRFTYNGIDRVDSKRGYTRDNIVPACIVCNRAKTDISQEEFLQWARRIVEKHNETINSCKNISKEVGRNS